MCKPSITANTDILNGDIVSILQLIIELWGIQQEEEKTRLTNRVKAQRDKLVPTGLGAFGKKDKTEADQEKDLKYNKAVDDWKNKLEGWQKKREEKKLTTKVGDKDFAKEMSDIAPSGNPKEVEKSAEKAEKRAEGRALKTIYFSDLPAQAPRVIQDIMSGVAGLKIVSGVDKKEINGINLDTYDPKANGKRSVTADGAGVVRSFHQNELNVLPKNTADDIHRAVEAEKDAGKKAISAVWHKLYGKDAPEDGEANLQKKQRNKEQKVTETGYYEVNVDDKGELHVQSRLIFDYVNFRFYFVDSHSYDEPQRVDIPEKLREKWLALAVPKEGSSPSCGEANQNLRAVRPSDSNNGTLYFEQADQAYWRHYTLGDGHCLYRSVLSRIGNQEIRDQFRTDDQPGIMASIRSLRLMTLIEMLHMRAAYEAGGMQDQALMVNDDDIINAITFGWGGDTELRAMARLFPHLRFEVTPMWNTDQPIVYNNGVVANNNTVRLFFTGNHYEYVAQG
ncbi:OTU domain-containing protein [Vibrio coralliilyticus]|uniref:OTU domain-containing protein n=1 Tax=Vibrio coralliilyticus TaxID=190893 RepID=UPI000BAAF5AD|nr:OTU domain-containing protein [Vibrio coralliilyticus]NOI57387.1 hypothetical protein [Vibrio coralliilyticus]PAT67840.1 hypothetical protein CKA27_11380 [Vibrio coralliilyticus]